MRAQHRFVVTLAAALALFGGPLAADDKATGFQLNLDRLDLAVYDVDVDTDSSKFNEYSDWTTGFAIPKMVITGGDAETGRYLSLRSSWVGRRDARYTLDYGVSGRWGMQIDYNKIPHHFGNNAKLLLTETAPGRFELSDTIQQALQTTLVNQFAANRNAINYAYLNNLLRPFLAASNTLDLGLQRDRTRAKLDLGKMGRMAWNLEYKQENRYGNRPYGAAFGFGSVVELPEPIDYKTSDAQISGELKGKKGGLTFGYRYSKFENDLAAMIWDNPFRITSSTDPSAYQAPGTASVGGSAIGLAALAPDNEASWMFVNGRMKAGTWNLSGALSFGTMEQNDPLQAYTENTAIVGVGFNGQTFAATSRGALPVSNADSKVDVLTFTGSANTRFADNWTLGFRVKYYDYDNKSATIRFPGYVRYHGVWEEIGRVTVPYAYTIEDYSADLGYSIGKDGRLGLMVARQSWDRKFREIETSDEDILRLTYDTKLGRLDLRFAYEMGDKSIGEYSTEAQEVTFIHPEGINNLPALRKYDEAAREYDAFSVRGHWWISDRVDLAFGVTSRDDDYTKSRFGLVGDELIQYDAELSFAIAEGSNLYVFYHRSDREVFQRSRQSGATPSTNPLDDWDVTFEEANDTAGLGYNMTSGKWKLDLKGTWNKSDGLADMFSPPGGAPNLAVGFDDYEDIEILSFKMALDYELTPNLSAGLDYRYEDYSLSSFITRGLTYYLPGALLLNGNYGDYTANVVGLRFKLRL